MDFLALRAAELDAANKIKTLADGEGRVMSDDELATFEAHIEKADELKAKSDKADALNARLSDATASLDKPMPRKTAPAALIDVAEPNFKNDPKKGFANHRDFFQAIIDNSKGQKDERLAFLAAAGSDDQQTQNDAVGGFLVPAGFSPNLLTIAPERDPTIGRTTTIPMQTNNIDIPARVDTDHSSSVAGGVTVARKQETAEGSSSQMKFKQIGLKVHTLFGASFVTEELLQDSPLSVAAIIANGFGQAFVDHLLDEKINGTGTGEYEGVVNSPAFVSVAKESGQTADTIVVENLLKMRSRCWGYNNAIWMANHDTYPQIAVVGGDGAGSGNLWQQSMVEGRPDMLLGRPIFFTEYTATIGDANDILLINWAEYLEATYQPMRMEESIHVRFLNNEKTFKFYTRNDGRGWWAAALTPRNSSNTLSPFVGLAERAA